VSGPARPPEHRTHDDERQGGRSTALTVLVGLLVLCMMLRGRRPHDKPVVADLKELLAEWEKDQAATRDKYRGKIIEVVGYLASEMDYRLSVRVRPSPKREPGKPELSVFIPPELTDKVRFLRGVKRKFRLRLDRPSDDLLDKSLPTRAVDILLP
jgi:hypothetical protein